MIVLLACLVSASFMAGLSWFVGAVHYPLFAGVGADGWSAYHRRHSDRTAMVVLPPMLVELGTAVWLVLDRPQGAGATEAIVALVLAAATWALTAVASRTHGQIGGLLDGRAHRSLLRVHHVRTACWTAHALLVAVMVMQAAE